MGLFNIKLLVRGQNRERKEGSRVYSQLLLNRISTTDVSVLPLAIMLLTHILPCTVIAHPIVLPGQPAQASSAAVADVGKPAPGL